MTAYERTFGVRHYRGGGRRTGDGSPAAAFSCGDLVVDRGDPRHIGEVRAVINGYWVILRWIETGWRSEVPYHRLDKAD